MQTRSKKKLHGQYFTESAYGDLLVNRFQNDNVRVAVELGLGGGALLSAVSARWPDARYVSVDIDPEHTRHSDSKSRKHSHFCADALNPELEDVIGLGSGVADLAVCNPPFIAADWKPVYATLLSRAGLPLPSKALKIGADLLFLAQNLWLLKNNGQLGIIIPAGIISGHRNASVREALLAQHCITEVIELPGNAFKGIEVKTFILNLCKNNSSSKNIALLRCNPDGSIEPPLWISQAEAKTRMDYSYYSWKKSDNSTIAKLEHNDFQVNRGSISTYQAKKLGLSIFHTTDLKAQKIQGDVHFPEILSRDISPACKVIAEAGDILIPRVGRNIHKGIHLVKSGQSPISDCLYRVRSNTRSSVELYNSLTSSEGSAWLQAHIHGACALFLTKADLLKFPF